MRNLFYLILVAMISATPAYAESRLLEKNYLFAVALIALGHLLIIAILISAYETPNRIRMMTAKNEEYRIAAQSEKEEAEREERDSQI